MTTRRATRPLWFEVYMWAGVLDQLRKERSPKYWRQLVPALEKLIRQFAAWKRAHPDYHPDAGYFDVQGVLELLQLALALARDAEDAHQRQAVSVAQDQANYATHH